MELPGRVVLTVSRGEVVWDGSRLLAPAGRGRVVGRERDVAHDG